MKKAFAVYKWLLAGATVCVGILFVWHLADILRSGQGAEQLYTYENIALRLRALQVPLGVYGFMCLAGMIWRTFLPEKQKSQGKGAYCAPEKTQPSGRLRLSLYVLALVLILLGIVNGGLWDVLVKAINICTECIGLG